jgi:hypothetical protein
MNREIVELEPGWAIMQVRFAHGPQNEPTLIESIEV